MVMLASCQRSMSFSRSSSRSLWSSFTYRCNSTIPALSGPGFRCPPGDTGLAGGHPFAVRALRRHGGGLTARAGPHLALSEDRRAVEGRSPVEGVLLRARSVDLGRSRDESLLDAAIWEYREPTTVSAIHRGLMSVRSVRRSASRAVPWQVLNPSSQHGFASVPREAQLRLIRKSREGGPKGTIRTRKGPTHGSPNRDLEIS